ncbi:MAG: hypothetical protein ACK4YP_17140 [Myxococcota bacterium]
MTRTRRRGQSTVEYMMTIAFIVIAIAAAMLGVYDTIAGETESTGRSMAESLTKGGTQN